MKKTSRGISKLAGVLVVFMVAFASIVAAAAVQLYIFPQKANVAGNVQVSFTLNGTAWANNTGFDWGIIQPGVWNNVSLNVYNAGNTNDSLVLIPQTMPSGCDQTWTLNNTVIAPAATAYGTLSMYVPAAYPPGNVTLPPIEIAVNQV